MVPLEQNLLEYNMMRWVRNEQRYLGGVVQYLMGALVREGIEEVVIYLNERCNSLPAQASGFFHCCG